jgi:DNA repair photolyase
VEELNTSGIKTYIFIGPILPHLTDWKKIILETKNYSNFYMFENLNVKGSIWSSIEQWLKEKHPEVLNEYEKIYFTKNNYWTEMEEEIKTFCDEQKIECRIYFHHGNK